MGAIKPTIDVLRVVNEFLREPEAWTFSSLIGENLGLAASTVHHIISKLERAGLIESDRENQDDAAAEQRGPRRYLKLTPAGEAWGREHVMQAWRDLEPSWEPAAGSGTGVDVTATVSELDPVG